MKITIIRHSIKDRGGDKVVNDYAGYLAGKGHEVIYWANEIKSGLYYDKSVKINRIPFKGKLGTMLFTALTNFHSDIVLTDIIIMGCCAWVSNSKRAIYFAQDYNVTYYSSKIMRSLLKAVYWVAFHMMKIPTVVVSESVAEKLKQHGLRGYFLAQTGIDLGYYYRKEPNELSCEKKSRFVILLSVYDDYRKGMDVAQKALIHLSKIRPDPDWEVWVIRQDMPPMGKVKIKNLKFLTGDDLRAALSCADIYLLPSRSEGLSILLLYALACQCVVVGTEAANIITSEVDGLISPVEDWKGLAENIDWVMNDRELFKKLRRNGSALVQKYDMAKGREQFEAVLMAIFKKRQNDLYV